MTKHKSDEELFHCDTCGIVIGLACRQCEKCYGVMCGKHAFVDPPNRQSLHRHWYCEPCIRKIHKERKVKSTEEYHIQKLAEDECKEKKRKLEDGLRDKLGLTTEEFALLRK